MNRNSIGVLVALVVVAGGWYMLRGNPASAPAAPEETQQPAVADASAATTTGVTVTYGPQGFSPASVSVPVGTTVTFVDQGTGKMWVASAVHPSHESYDGTSKAEHCAANYTGPAPFDQCSVGTSYSFAFSKTGVWKYHNHANAADTGTVTVVSAAAPSGN